MKRKKNSVLSGRKSFQYRGTKCLNCNHPLDKSDVYCPSCSQLNSDKPLSIKDFFTEFLSSILVYDSRLRTTIKDLLFRPGVITRNYVNGQRLKYANPFRFFLSVSIIYFLIEGFAGYISSPGDFKAVNFQASDQVNIDSLFIDRPSDTFSDVSYGDSLKAKALGISFYYPDEVLDSLPFFEKYSKRSSLYTAYYYRSKIEEPIVALDSLDHTNSFKHRWLYSRAVSFYKITHNFEEFKNYILAKFPFYLFFFAPFYALFFWLLYSRKKFTYMEHIVFVFHIFSFIFLTMVIFRIPELLIGFDFYQTLLFIIIGPLYFFFALRKFYEQGKWLTLLKFVFLNFIFILGFTIATIFFVTASAAIY